MEELSIRQRLEQAEHENLAPWAAFADASRGRAYPEAPCQMRTCYQRDVDRIAYSKAFRRLMHKTQGVFAAGGRPLPHPDDPHLSLIHI